MSDGYEFIWDELAGLDPAEVEKKASVRWDAQGGSYALKSLGMEFNLSVAEKKVSANGEAGDALLSRHGFFFINSALMYLARAKEVPTTGKLVKPSELKGGDIFFRGSHVLPLDLVARKYGEDKDAFIGRARELGGEPQEHGDASVMLSPLPRVPVFVILWLGDDEFPPRADLLLDSSCELHLPLDVLWSVAMLSTLVMM